MSSSSSSEDNNNRREHQFPVASLTRRNSIGFDLDDMENEEMNENFFDDVSINTKQNAANTSSKDNVVDNNSEESSKNSRNSGGSASKNSRQSKSSNKSGYSAGSAVVQKSDSDDNSFHSAQDSIDSDSIQGDNFQDVKNAFEDRDTKENTFKLFRPKTWRRRSPSPSAPENIDLELSWEEPFQDPKVVKTGIATISRSSSPTSSMKKAPHLKPYQTMKSTSFVLCALFCLAFTSWLSVLLVQSQLEMSLFNGILRQSGKVDDALEAVLLATANPLIGLGTVLIRFDVDQRVLVRIHVDGTNGIPIRSEQGTWQILDGESCTFDSNVPVVANNPLNDEKFPTGPNIWTRTTTPNNNGVSVQARHFGKNVEQLEGHAMVLFEEDNAMLACGVLNQKNPNPSVKHVLWAYPKNDLNDNQGKVRLDFYSDDTFHFGFNFTNTPTTNAVTAALEEQPSPMTIENYGSCQQVAEPQFYYNLATGMINPWTLANGAYYTTSASAEKESHGFYMYDGYTYEEHIGRTVVMRDSTGAVLACGELHREIDTMLISGLKGLSS